MPDRQGSHQAIVGYVYGHAGTAVIEHHLHKVLIASVFGDVGCWKRQQKNPDHELILTAGRFYLSGTLPVASNYCCAGLLGGSWEVKTQEPDFGKSELWAE